MKTIELNSAGNTIIAQIFEPTTFNGRLILMNSATGAKQTYFRHFANYLCERGFRVTRPNDPRADCDGVRGTEKRGSRGPRESGHP